MKSSSPAGPRRAALGVCLLAVALSGPGCGGSADAGRGPIVLITVDTLRADRVGIYRELAADLAAPRGGHPLPTPAVDRLARAGAVALTAWAPMGRTTQSVGSILTGLHPCRHGADGLAMKLPAEVATLAEQVRAAGFETAAFVSNVNLKKDLGFDQGFDTFSNPRVRWRDNGAEAITDEALAWIASRRDDRWFLWVHYLDPHWTYEPAPEWSARADPDWDEPFDLFERQDRREVTKGEIVFRAPELLDARAIEHTRRLYDGEVGATDAAIGRLLDALERDGVSEHATIVFTADHGESLGEHDYWFAHGEYLYDDTLRVPWIVRAPGRIPAGTIVEGTVRLEDTAPTVLALAGLEVPPDLDGQVLAEALAEGGRVALPSRELVHMTDHNLIHPENPRHHRDGRDGRWWALRKDGFKLIRIPLAEDGAFDEELYDLAADPHETTDLAARDPQRVAALRERLVRFAKACVPRDEQGERDAGLDEALRGLGYAVESRRSGEGGSRR